MKRTITALLAGGVAAFALMFAAPAESEARHRHHFRHHPHHSFHFHVPRHPGFHHRVHPGFRHYHYYQPYTYRHYYHRHPGGGLHLGPLRLYW